MNDSKILVIGDITIDETIFLNAIGLSIETPTMKTEFIDKNITMGASFNVAKNIATLKKNCIFLSTVGDDEYENIIRSNSKNNLDLNLLPMSNKKNNVKTRYWINNGDSNYKYLQVNRYPNRCMSNNEEENFYLEFCNILESSLIETIVLVDYMTGSLTKNLIQRIIKTCHSKNIKSIGSIQLGSTSSVDKCKSFKNVDLFVCNESEINQILGGISKEKIKNFFNNDVCITLGNKGCMYFSKNKDSIIISKSFSFNVIDTCGAGDSFLASMVVNSNNNLNEMLMKANLWAGLSTTMQGTKKPCYKEYERNLNEIK